MLMCWDFFFFELKFQRSEIVAKQRVRVYTGTKLGPVTVAELFSFTECHIADLR